MELFCNEPFLFQCDKLCGEGKRTRKVTCYIEENGRKKVLSDENCVEDKPEVETTCMLAPCEGVDWILSPWSGVSKDLNKYYLKCSNLIFKCISVRFLWSNY